ncbi:DUF438 domain-containing protein [Fredinandcohnia humi]
MSEIINNRETHINSDTNRLSLLKEGFMDLHHGKNIKEIKERLFNQLGPISIEEISNLQHSLMEEEGIQASEAKDICSKHMEVLKDLIDRNSPSTRPEEHPGHPVHTFKLENRELEKVVNESLVHHLELFVKEDTQENISKLLEDCNSLLDIDKHFNRKEHLLFPYLEKYGIYGPTNMMWRIDDYIRDGIKEAKRMLLHYEGEKQPVLDVFDFVQKEVNEMIYREENILFPMALKNLTEDEWVKIAYESDEIGYCLTEPVEWKPGRLEMAEKAISEGYIKMETGILSLKQLELLLNHLPVDITFIDQDDVVRYFSHGNERIFARTKAVIGRTVQNCHPPKSVHVVEELLEDFKSGNKDCEDFWIKFKDKYVYIRYFAVRDEKGNYVGTLEFTQNIKPIQEIEGEKRILS